MAFTGHTLPFIPLFSLHVSNMIASPRTEVRSLQSSLVLSPSMNNQSKQACGKGGLVSVTRPIKMLPVLQDKHRSKGCDLCALHSYRHVIILHTHVVDLSHTRLLTNSLKTK